MEAMTRLSLRYSGTAFIIHRLCIDDCAIRADARRLKRRSVGEYVAGGKTEQFSRTYGTTGSLYLEGNIHIDKAA